MSPKYGTCGVTSAADIKVSCLKQWTSLPSFTHITLQTYEGEEEKVSEAFWEDVKQMSRVRHENIVLFMGVCTAKGNLALVTR